MRYLFLVLDGAGDVGKDTPFSLARKPNMEKLAEKGMVGLLDIGYKKAVNSDFGYLNLLGCYSRKDYPGRGYLEALGIGLKPGPNDICIRGNFATLDRMGNVRDRRAGRDESGLDRLAEKIDGMVIDGISITIKRSMGHRVVIVLKGKGLSENIIPNDPLKTGVALPQVKAKTRDGRLTASVLNRFLTRTRKILDADSVNRKRKCPANIILVRNIGKKKVVKSFKERYGLRGCCVAGIAIAHGVSRYLGMDVIKVPGATGMPDTNLDGKFRAARKALDKYDLVFLHINGTDILSHDAKPGKKKRMIEDIDQYLGTFKLPALVTIVTCDHRTASSPEFMEYRHTTDPVPVLVAGPFIGHDSIGTFNEDACKNGFKLKGDGLLPFVFKQVRMGEKSLEKRRKR